MSNKNITKWSKMTLRNNYMFRLVMEKNNLCKPLIDRVLGIKIKSLSYVEPEKSFEAKLRTKGIRLDLFVIDEDGVAYDIEMQMDNSYKQFLGKRSRYYVSLMDNGALKKDEPYSNLRKSYVILSVLLIHLEKVWQNTLLMLSATKTTAWCWMMA